MLRTLPRKLTYFTVLFSLNLIYSLSEMLKLFWNCELIRTNIRNDTWRVTLESGCFVRMH